MSVDEVLKFYQQKRPWSRYKDLILDYYLKPYLAKVARLGPPIAIVDCFAGAGKFGGEEPGSPLIIGKRLEDVHRRGIEVVGMFIEAHASLFDELSKNVKELNFPVRLRKGDFREYVDEIAELATTHTVFVYVDPIKPGHLQFDDLSKVYKQLRKGTSVETLINFQSRGFVRRAEGLRHKAIHDGVLDLYHREVVSCDRIAGGKYWHDIVYDASLSECEKITKVAEGFSYRLKQWFRYALPYPVKRNYHHQLPKYHLVFGSRHPDALELINRAMVSARRKFVSDEFVVDMLFANEPAEELVNDRDVIEHVVCTLRRVHRTTWKMLRVEAIIGAPCKYLDSELNRAIKSAIASDRIHSTATGRKIENSAEVWITESGTADESPA